MPGALDIIASVVAGAIALTAVGIAARGLWGDRARGCKRCPKCWYDMSAAKAATTPTGATQGAPTPAVAEGASSKTSANARLTCPECGRASLPRELTHTRRRWGRAAAALLILLPLAHVTSVQSHIRAEGWTGLVPNWALIAGVVLLPGEKREVRAVTPPGTLAPDALIDRAGTLWRARRQAGQWWPWELTLLAQAHDMALRWAPEGDPRVDGWIQLRDGMNYSAPDAVNLTVRGLAPPMGERGDLEPTERMLLKNEAFVFGAVNVRHVRGGWWHVHAFGFGPRVMASRFEVRSASHVHRAQDSVMAMPSLGHEGKGSHFLVRPRRDGRQVEVVLTPLPGTPVATPGEAVLRRLRLTAPERRVSPPLAPHPLDALRPVLAASLDAQPFSPNLDLSPTDDQALLDELARRPFVLRAELRRDGVTLVERVIATELPGTWRGPYRLASSLRLPGGPPTDTSGVWTLRLTGDERLTSIFPEATSYWAGTIEIPMKVLPPRTPPNLPPLPPSR